MKLKFTFQVGAFLFLNAFLFPLSGYAQKGALMYNTPIGVNCNGYYERLPSSYVAKPTKEYPLFIYIHGVGLYGNGGNPQLNKIVEEGTNTPPYRAWRGWLPSSFTVNGENFEFILITPQWIEEPYIKGTSIRDVGDVLNYCLSHYRVDRSRIYLGSQSGGGSYILNYASSNSENADQISALVASSPASQATQGQANIISAAKIPVWIAVSELDEYWKDDGDMGRSKRYAESWVNDITNATPPPIYIPGLTVIPGENSHNTAASYLYDPVSKIDGTRNVYEWILQYKRTVLPVTGLELFVKPTGSMILLSWKTRSEKNNKEFQIQHSDDGIKFQNIGIVSASGGELGSDYQFKDENPVNGKNYYRIAQVDFDGRSSYSEIVTTTLHLTGKLRVYPNPVKDILTIAGSEVFATGTIQIFDGKGSLKMESPVRNINEKQIDVSRLSNGFYTGRIISGKNKITFSFVKD